MKTTRLQLSALLGSLACTIAAVPEARADTAFTYSAPLSRVFLGTSQWFFDEGSGSVATGSIDQGAFVNNPGWGSPDQCHSGTCLSLTGATPEASVAVPYTSNLKFGTGDFTVAAWIKTTDLGNRAIVGPNVYNVSSGWQLETGSGKTSLGLFGPGSINGFLGSNVTIADGAWHLVAARRSGTTVSLIVDGQAVSATVASTYNSDAASDTLRIGARNGVSNEGFVGRIDDIRIVGEAVGDADLAAWANPRFQGQFLLSGDSTRIVGVACKSESLVPATVQVYAGNPAQGGVLIAEGSATQTPDASVPNVCGSGNPGFQFDLPGDVRSAHAGSLLYLTAGGGSDLLAGSGSFRLPKSKGGDWTFDEGAGSVTAGSINNGTLVNGPVWTSADQCHAGPCLTFTSQTGQASVNVPYSDALRFGTGDFTVSAWVKTSSSSSRTTVVGANRSGILESWALWFENGKAYFSNWGPSVNVTLSPQAKMNDGAWHLLVGRRQGTKLSFVVDGGLVGSATIPASHNSNSGASTLRIGNQEGSSSAGFVGSIDDVRLVGRALTDDELGITRPRHLSAINLRSMANNKLITADPRGTPLLAGAQTADEWESFLFEDLGGGVVALRTSNTKYVRAENGGASPLIATSPSVAGTWEKYQWIDLGDQKFALRSLANNLYVQAQNAGTGSLQAVGTSIGSWETFTWEKAPVPMQVKGKVITLSDASFSGCLGAMGTMKTMEQNPSHPLFTASLDPAKEYQSIFQVVDLGDGKVAFKAMGSNFYVSATSVNGGHKLTPNATEIGPWETFEWVYLGGTKVLDNRRFALRSLGNNQFVKPICTSVMTSIGVMQSMVFEPLSASTTGSELQWGTASDGSSPVNGGGFSFVYDKVYGNKDIGLNLWIVTAATNKTALDALLAKVEKTSAPGKALDRLLPDASSQVSNNNFAQVLGDAGVSVSLFGNTAVLLEAGGYVRHDLTSSLAITAQGSSIYNGSLALEVERSITKTFLKYNQQFMVGPVPLTISADMTGTVKVSSVLTPSSSRVTSTTTPGLDLGLNVSGGVGTSFLSAGVESSLNLLDTSMPLGLTYNTDRSYQASSRLTLAAMQGSLSLYAEAKIKIGIIKFKKKYSKKIAGWDGVSLGNTTLLDTGGTL